MRKKLWLATVVLLGSAWSVFGAGDFSGALPAKNWRGWMEPTLKDAGSSFEVQGETLSVRVNNPDPRKYDHYFQICNAYVRLPEHKAYRFSFVIDSTKAGSIEVICKKGAKPWTRYFGERVRLKAGENRCSIRIVCDSQGKGYDGRNSLDFRVGRMDGAQLTIRDMTLTADSAKNEFNTYYSPEVYKNLPVKETRAEIDAALALYRKKLPEIGSLQAAFKQDGDILADCVTKRAEITARLVAYIEKTLKSTEPDALAYARQEKIELLDLLGYFDELKQRREYLKTHPAMKVFSIKEFGAVGDGAHNDAPAFAKAFDAARKVQGPVKITVPKGVYRFGEKYIPKKTFASDRDGWKTAAPFYMKQRSQELNCLHIPAQRNLNNVTVEGAPGTLLLGSDPGIGFFLFIRCNYLTLRNLTFDYETLPGTQGVITAVDKKTQTVTLKIDAGYPDLDYDYFLSAAAFSAVAYDAKTGRQIRAARDKWVKAVKPLGDRTYQVKFGRTTAKVPVAGLEPGRKLAIMARTNKLYSAIAGNTDCRHLMFDRLTVYSGPGCAFGGFRSYAANVIGCRLLPHPARPGQLLCLNADPCMVSGAIIGPYVASNHFERAGDDFANNCVGGSQIDSCSDDGGIMVAGAGIWQAGKMVSVVNRADGTIRGESMVKSARELPGWKAEIVLADPVKGVVSRQSLDRKKRSQKEEYDLAMNSLAYRDQTDRKHPDLLINRVSHASGTILVGNEFRRTRAGGIFSKVSNSLIADNTVAGAEWAGELIIMFAHHYLECHAPHCIVVRNNKFIDNGCGVLAFYSLYRGNAEKLTPIRDIDIEGNLFKNTGESRLTNCRDVRIVGNRFESHAPLKLDCVRNVTVENNRFDLPRANAVTTTVHSCDVVVKDNHYPESMKEP